MKKYMNTIILAFVFTFVLAGKQSTPAIAGSTHNSLKINNHRTRIIQATEVLDDNFTLNIAKNDYSDYQIKKFINNKMKISLPQHYQSRSKKLTETLMAQASLYNMDPLFVVALIEHESKFNPKALGRFGEQGLMQIKPSTAVWIAKKYHLASGKQYSLYNPVHNLKFGVAYLDYLRKKFHGSGQFYVEAYNMGPQRMHEFMKLHEVRKTYQHQVQNHYLALYEDIEKSTSQEPPLERHPRIARMKARFMHLFLV